MDKWLDVSCLSNHTLLIIKAECQYQAHTALRHAHEVDLGNYKLDIQLPEKLRRKGSGFGPWLRRAATARIVSGDTPANQVAALSFVASTQHVHSPQGHFTTLELRIGGKQVRALLDSGATCSCMSNQFALSIGTPIATGETSIGGIAGTVQTLGKCTTSLKLRKFHAEQSFQVLSEQIAGYDIILGQDFCQVHEVEIKFLTDKVSFTIGTSEDNQTKFSQSLDNSRNVLVNRSPNNMALPIVLTTQAPTDVLIKGKEPGTPASRSQMSKCRKHMQQKRQVAYRVHLSKDNAVCVTSEKDEIPPELQPVIDKHSQPGGTLCGEIPANTHALGYDCKIDLKEGVQPAFIRQYRLTPLEKTELIQQVSNFIAKGWIEPSVSPWCSSVLFVPKPNGKLRFCVDFRKINEATVPDRGTPTLQAELLDSLEGMRYFSALDLASGYYQLKLDEKSRACTAFPTPEGLMQWRVMPMGLSNAPAIFQTAMNQILREHIHKGYCLVYLDDIIIMSRTMAEHPAHLDAVLKSLNAHNLFCQLPKCFWGKTELTYLGHLVNGDGVRPDPKKVETLDKWKAPVATAMLAIDPNVPVQLRNSYKKKLVKECRSFLGFMNYFNRFIPRYSETAACLHDQTKDESPPWTSDCTAAWQAMCLALKRATLMRHPRPNDEYHVFSDASIRGIGGVLMQYDNCSTDNKLAPVAYCARKMIPAETNYSTTEQELLAMIFCFLKWRCYLEGAPKVYMHTDHEPLTWLKTQAAINRRQSHWLEFMARFRYEVLYIKGDKNVVADALTRMIELPEAEQPHLPGEWWPQVVAALTTLAGCRTSQRHSKRGPEGSWGPGAVLKVQQETACSITATHSGHSTSEQVYGRSNDSSRGAWTHNLFTAAGSVAAGGYTRRTKSVGGDIVGGEISDTLGIDPQLPNTSPKSCLMKRKTIRIESPNERKHLKRVKFNLVPQVEIPSNNSNSPLQASGTVEAVPNGTISRPTAPQQMGSEADQDPQLTDHQGVPSESYGANHLSKDHNYDRLFDELFTRIRTDLSFDEATSTDDQRKRLGLTVTNGLYWYKNRLYIPQGKSNLRDDLMYWHHDVPWCSHLGIEKTVRLLSHQFYWPSMENDIRTYISSCVPCQGNKTDRTNRRLPLVPLSPPDACWQTLGVDLIVDLPQTRDGYDTICVFVCHLSKMVRLVPTDTSLDAIAFAKMFFREIFPHYGMPQKIVSDRGSQWNSTFFQEICRLAGVQLSLSTSHHPQTNGLVERTNEVVETALRHYVSASYDDWSDYLPLIEFALNNAYHKALGGTPFELNRVTLPKNPFEVLLKSEGDLPRSSNTRWMGLSTCPLENGQRTMVQAQSQFEFAKKCVHLSKSRMKEQHDKKLKGARHLYEIGDKVWFNMKHLKLKHPSLRHKFVPRFMGPVTVLDVVGPNALRLDFPPGMLIHPTISSSLVKEFRGRWNNQFPAINIDGIEEFEIEQIVSHNIPKSRRKNVKKVVEFLVRWKGGYEDCWEEFDSFINGMDVLNTYISSNCNKSVRNSIYSVLDTDQRLRLTSALQAEATSHLNSLKNYSNR